MSQYDTTKPHDLSGYVLTVGTPVTHDPVALGCTLGVGTYVFPLGSERSAVARETALVSIHVKWAAAVAATITIESCNFPQTLTGGGQGAADVSDWDSTAGNWLQENPTTAYVPVSGSGNSATNMTVTAGGSAAGGAMFTIGNMGPMRMRLKIVTTAGGLVRVNVHGKVGD